MIDKFTPEGQILRNRIRFALRRVTGVAFDIDAMLSKPELRAQRISMWREFGSDELSSLLDRPEAECHGNDEAVPASARIALRA